MFVQGTQQLIETGVMNYLRDTYEGNFIPVVSDAETMVLKSGQVVLMFAIIFLAFFVSFSIFIVEYGWYLKKRRNPQKDYNWKNGPR